MRKIAIICVGVISLLFPHGAFAEANCLTPKNIFEKTLPEIGKAWTHISLRVDQKEKYVVFMHKEDSASTSQADWLLFSKQTGSLLGLYCLDGLGHEVDLTASLQDATFEERYGLPGSGLPRCGNASDPLEGVKVRSWANKELGDSLNFGLSKPENKKDRWVLVLSKTDGFWILLLKQENLGTCYFDRGQESTINEVTLPPQQKQ